MFSSVASTPGGGLVLRSLLLLGLVPFLAARPVLAETLPPHSSYNASATEDSIARQLASASSVTVSSFQATACSFGSEGVPALSVAIIVVTSSEELNSTRRLQRYPLINKLAPAVREMVKERGFVFQMFVGYPASDPLFSSARVRRAFNGLWVHLTKHKPLFFVALDSISRPATAYNSLAMLAYRNNFDYIFRVRPESDFVDTRGMISAFACVLMQRLPQNYGLVGPQDLGSNGLRFRGKTVWHEFLSRKHIDVFGFYYPPSFTSQFASAWLTGVYYPRFYDRTWHRVKHPSVLRDAQDLRDWTLRNEIKIGVSNHLATVTKAADEDLRYEESLLEEYWLEVKQDKLRFESFAADENERAKLHEATSHGWEEQDVTQNQIQTWRNTIRTRRKRARVRRYVPILRPQEEEKEKQ